MVKRLFAFVAALSIVSAPIALEVCQITCESTGMSPSMPHALEGHAAHHHAPADHAACHEHRGAPQELSPVNGLCDHGTESAPSLVAAKNWDTPSTLLATVPSIDSIRLVPTRDGLSVRESAWSDRLGTPLAVPLRV